MGEIGELIVVWCILGVLVASPFVVYRAVTIPRLARNAARPAAYVLTAIPAMLSLTLLVIHGVAVLGDGPRPRFLFALILLCTVLGNASDRLVGAAIRVTGGARPDRSIDETLLGVHLDVAERNFVRGDLDSWAAELHQLARRDVPGADGLRAAARQIIDAARVGDGRTIHRAHRGLRREAAAFWSGPSHLRSVAAVAAVMAFLIGGGPIAVGNYGGADACSDADRLLSDLVRTGSSDGPLARSLPDVPEAGSRMTIDVAMNLEETVDSRHDPNTRGQLVAAGFVAAHARQWVAFDGRVIQADVMEFDSAGGAASYLAEVTRYACRFSNLAFSAPDGGVGLQVTWSSGDPIGEQISWVVGTRRLLASVRHPSPPSDHARILAVRAAFPDHDR